MPKYNADGDVIDITLNTVKVMNFDKTITMIPSYALISDSFRNWRGMQVSGGRRIKRSIYIDISSIRFCTEEMVAEFEKIHYLTDYVTAKLKEIQAYNMEHEVNTESNVNGRQLTNVGVFREYIHQYLRNHPKINKDMTMIVRQLAPEDRGLPWKSMHSAMISTGVYMRTFRRISLTISSRWRQHLDYGPSRIQPDMTLCTERG